MCFVFVWEQTATCATYSIYWLVFITERKSVYSAVRTGYLNEADWASSLKGYMSRVFFVYSVVSCLTSLSCESTSHVTTSEFSDPDLSFVCIAKIVVVLVIIINIITTTTQPLVWHVHSLFPSKFSRGCCKVYLLLLFLHPDRCKCCSVFTSSLRYLHLKKILV
jgi:hypothetical protein